MARSGRRGRRASKAQSAPVGSFGPSVPSSEMGDPGVFRDQVRAARDELESHVLNAREHIDQANERLKERTGRDLVVAIAIGLGIGVVLLGSLLIIKWLFVPVALVGILLGVFEYARALILSGRRVDVIPQLVAGAMVVLAGYFLSVAMLWVTVFVAVAFVIVWRLVAQMVASDGRSYGDVVGDAAVSGFVQIYLPLLAALALVILRQPEGEFWILAFVIIAVSVDTAAYGTGLALGRHPMAPRISPKKTWEGFAGGGVASVVAGVLLAVFLLGQPWWVGAILGASVLVTATLGDLGESMLKRDMGIKDMSSWLPGHGGILDRLDSILPSTIPTLLVYVATFPLVVQ